MVSSSCSDLDRHRYDIASACRQLAAEGLVIGTAGNVSVRVGDLVAITATGAAFTGMVPEHVTVVDRTGRVVGSGLVPTSEVELHLGIYDSCGAGAVVHTHAPMATALSCVLDELPCLHYALLELGGPVRVAPYATFGTAELASNVLDALDGRTGALMSNHGAVTYADDLDTAVERGLLLEWACTVYWRAASIGNPRVLDEVQCAAVTAAMTARDYGTTKIAT